MNVKYLFRGIKLEEKTRNYVEKRIQKLEKFLEKIAKTEVEIDLDKKRGFRAEIMVKTPRHLYRSEEISESAEASTDVAVEEIISQIKKKKEKSQALRERRARSVKKAVVLDEGARFKKS